MTGETRRSSNLARLLKGYMKDRGLNQSQLAAVLGVAPASVTYWMQGRTMTAERAWRISVILGVSVEELLR